MTCGIQCSRPRLLELEEGISALAFRPNHDQFALGSDTGTLQLWQIHAGDPLTFSERLFLNAHAGPSLRLGFQPGWQLPRQRRARSLHPCRCGSQFRRNRLGSADCGAADDSSREWRANSRRCLQPEWQQRIHGGRRQSPVLGREQRRASRQHWRSVCADCRLSTAQRASNLPGRKQLQATVWQFLSRTHLRNWPVTPCRQQVSHL